MGLRIPFLATFFLLVALQTGYCAAPEVSCHGCHPVHHAERGSCVSCHRGNPATLRMNISHHGLIAGRFAWSALAGSEVVERGKRKLEDAACRRCHQTAGRGNRLAGNLDSLATRHSPERLLKAIRSPALYMPDFRFSESQAVELVNALLAASGERAVPEKEIPLVIHFVEEKREEDPFTRYCGSCHRVLSPLAGGLGEGRVAPNLSGLLTEFYTPTYADGERWTVKGLEKWVKNPRSVKNTARMIPVRIDSPEEFSRLLPHFGASAQTASQF